MIVRAIALKDATGTALTSCGPGTAFDLGALEADQKVYAGLHILTSSTGGIRVRIFSGSSSGFTAGNPGTCRFGFTSQSCRGSEWPTPITGAFATCQRYWRAEWSLTTSGESYKILPWMYRGCV